MAVAAFQGVEPRPQFRVGVGKLTAVAGVTELRCESQQQHRKRDNQRRSPTPRGTLPVFRASVFPIFVSRWARHDAPESIQLLTCLLLQQPPASAIRSKHFACQLSERGGRCHPAVT